jgi:hypothetical protein
VKVRLLELFRSLAPKFCRVGNISNNNLKTFHQNTSVIICKHHHNSLGSLVGINLFFQYCINMLHLLYKTMLVASLLFILLPRNSESLQCSSRRTFFKKAAATTSVIATAACCGNEAASAAIDVSGLKIESESTNTQTTPGRAPNQPPSGPLAGSSLGFQVAGGPRPENEVRQIDEARYAAVRKAQGKGPLFLEGVPLEGESPDKSGR